VPQLGRLAIHVGIHTTSAAPSQYDPTSHLLRLGWLLRPSEQRRRFPSSRATTIEVEAVSCADRPAATAVPSWYFVLCEPKARPARSVMSDFVSHLPLLWDGTGMYSYVCISFKYGDFVLLKIEIRNESERGKRL
jgi:hypothetical protein